MLNHLSWLSLEHVRFVHPTEQQLQTNLNNSCPTWFKLLTRLCQAKLVLMCGRRHNLVFEFQVLSNGSAMQTSVASGSTSTPNSSISNMACLPESEDRLSNPATNMTPSPPPPTPPTTSTTAIYARVNPNLKRDKTNNNNFTSTFSSTSTASQFQALQPSLMKSSPSSSLVTPPSGSTTNTLDYQKLGMFRDNLT